MITPLKLGLKISIYLVPPQSFLLNRSVFISIPTAKQMNTVLLSEPSGLVGVGVRLELAQMKNVVVLNRFPNTSFVE